MNVFLYALRVGACLGVIAITSGCGGSSPTSTVPAAVPSTSSASSASAPSLVQSPAPTLAGNLDANLTSQERAVMLRSLVMLPPNDRANVIVFDSAGRAYANRPALRDSAEFFNESNFGALSEELPGEALTLSERLGTQGLTRTQKSNVLATGYSHDEYGELGQGAFQGTTNVDCAHTRLGASQGADIYTGARSFLDASQQNPIEDAQIDAGLEMDSDVMSLTDAPRQPTKVQMFMSISRGAQHFAAGSAREVYLQCDSSVTIEFRILQSAIFVAYTGSFTDKTASRGQVPATLVYLMLKPYPLTANFTPDCQNCYVKRVNSLTVHAGSPVSRLGAYTGLPSPCDPTSSPSQAWTNTFAGTLSTTGAFNYLPFTSFAYSDSPEDGQTNPKPLSAIRVAGALSSSESIGFSQATCLDLSP